MMSSRPAEFEQAVRMLRAWEGLAVTVRIRDQSDADVAWVWGILDDRSTANPPRLEFGLDEPGNPTAVFPLMLDGAYRCSVDRRGVSIEAGGGTVVLITLTPNAPRGLTGDDHDRRDPRGRPR